MIKSIGSNQLLPVLVQNRNLMSFQVKKQIPNRSMVFRKIGSDDLSHYNIKHRILYQPGINAPVRRNNLLTMAPTKTLNKRNMNLEKRLNK